MIKQAIITNFQSHKHSVFDFSKGVNIIVGLSDTGKSAILRALRLLIWNRPSGDSFRSDWGGDTEIEILTYDGYEVKRIKTDKQNSYEITGLAPFNAVKTEVPDEIKETLNINEINFKSQADDHFLIKNTPGEVAQHFNRIAHLEQIDKGLKNVDSWLRKKKQDVEYDKSEVERLERDLQQFEYLDQFEQQIEVLEDLESQVTQKQNSIITLQKTVSNIESIDSKIAKKSKITERYELTKELITYAEGIEEVEQQQAKLKAKIKQLNKIDQDIEVYNKLLNIPKLSELLLNREQYKKITTQLTQLKAIVKKLNTTDKNEKKQQGELKAINEELNQYQGQVCPLCDGKGEL